MKSKIISIIRQARRDVRLVRRARVPPRGARAGPDHQGRHRLQARAAPHLGRRHGAAAQRRERRRRGGAPPGHAHVEPAGHVRALAAPGGVSGALARFLVAPRSGVAKCRAYPELRLATRAAREVSRGGAAVGGSAIPPLPRAQQGAHTQI